MQESKSPNKGIITLVVIVLLVAAASAAVVLGSNKQPVNNTSAASAVAASPSVSISPNATFKDGTYTATAKYDTPGGSQSMTVKLTVASGSVTDSSIQQTASSSEDQQFEDGFDSAYKSQVIGKKLSDINLHSVSGASLTTDGFNSALGDIAKQAQA